MNIRDFLIDNYIYIIIVIILIIVTIIGFLADKKKNGEKKTKVANNNQSAQNSNAAVYTPATSAAPITYQPTDNNLNNVPNNGLNFNGMNTTITPINSGIQGPTPMTYNPSTGSVPEPVNNMNLNVPNQMVMNNGINTPQPVEPISNNLATNAEPMYQPLSEQKPVIAPTMNNAQPVVGEPMQANPIEMATGEPISAVPNMGQAPSMAPTQSMAEAPVAAPAHPMNMENNMNIPNNETPMANPAPMQPQQMAAPIAGPMPQAVPEPIPNPTENTVPNPITPPEPVNPSPIGFVYGPQQNNNQNM